MKKIVLALSCLFVCSLFSKNSFKIVRQSPAYQKVGYGDWYMESDGELTLMQHILKPGAVVFDVGGHLGEWSLCALKTEPTINLVSFEPVPDVYNKLKSTLDQYKNVSVFNMAFSDKNGQSPYFYYSSTLQESGLSGFYYREVLRGDHQDPITISVRHQTLDSFCAEHAMSKIDFLKIDTEGSELNILMGAQQLLKHHQIRAIQFEYGGCYVDAKTTLKQVMQLFTENGYAVFRIFQGGLIHIAKWHASLENFNLSNYCALCVEDMPEYGLVKF